MSSTDHTADAAERAALELYAPSVGTIGYCRTCREAIIVRETSRSSAWAHRNSGLIGCGEPWRNATGGPAFAAPTPRDPAGEPELERLRRLPCR